MNKRRAGAAGPPAKLPAAFGCGAAEPQPGCHKDIEATPGGRWCGGPPPRTSRGVENQYFLRNFSCRLRHPRNIENAYFQGNLV